MLCACMFYITLTLIINVSYHRTVLYIHVHMYNDVRLLCICILTCCIMLHRCVHVLFMHLTPCTFMFWCCHVMYNSTTTFQHHDIITLCTCVTMHEFCCCWMITQCCNNVCTCTRMLDGCKPMIWSENPMWTLGSMLSRNVRVMQHNVTWCSIVVWCNCMYMYCNTLSYAVQMFVQVILRCTILRNDVHMFYYVIMWCKYIVKCCN